MQAIGFIVLLFVLLQAIGFITLWIVKSTSAALAFPFFVVGMIPFRLSFRLIFSKQELDAVSPALLLLLLLLMMLKLLVLLLMLMMLLFLLRLMLLVMLLFLRLYSAFHGFGHAKLG
jgi:hypothetical protein